MTFPERPVRMATEKAALPADCWRGGLWSFLASHSTRPDPPKPPDPQRNEPGALLQASNLPDRLDKRVESFLHGGEVPGGRGFDLAPPSHRLVPANRTTDREPAAPALGPSLRGNSRGSILHRKSRRGGMADAEDLKSSGRKRPCGFDSHRRYWTCDRCGGDALDGSGNVPHRRIGMAAHFVDVDWCQVWRLRSPSAHSAIEAKPPEGVELDH